MQLQSPIETGAIPSSGRAGTMLRDIAAPVILLVIVIGFFWKVVLTDQFSWIESADIANQVVPWLDYEARQLHSHNLPLWDPFLFGGQSLIGQGQPGAAYPLNWILFLLPLQNGHINFTILNWYFLAIHYLAALFCYFLCRDLGRGKVASIAGGLVFGLGGFVGNTDWPQMINGAIWAPLVFLFLFRTARGVRPLASAAFSGLFLGMSWLSGHHQIPIFLTLATAGVWLGVLFRQRRLDRSMIVGAAVFAAFFVCSSALQTWPAYEYGRLALRWVGSPHDPIAWNQPVPYTVHEQYSISPIYLVGLLIPGFQPGFAPSAYVGVVGLAFAALGLACCWSIREVRLLCAIGVGGLFIAIARNDVFHGILYSVVPLVEKARSPATAICLFQFAIAVLVAFGLDAMFDPGNQARARRLMLVLLGFGGLVFLMALAVDLSRAMNWGFDDRVMVSVLSAFALAGLVYRSRRANANGRRIGALVIGLYLIEQGNLAFYYIPPKDDKNLSIYLTSFDTTKPVAEFLKRQPGLVRADISREDIQFNFGDWYGIDAMTGILPSLPRSLCNLEFGSDRTRLLYGTNYAVGRKPSMDGQREIFRDNSGLIVFENPRALPRVWTVHESAQVKNAAEADRYMQDAAFDLRAKTFGYSAPPPMERCEGDAIGKFERGINSTTMVVDMKCSGIVIQAENYAPGWSATVDGRATPIYEAYTALRAVIVGPGVHTIEMRYWPRSVIGGAAATLAAFIGALCLLVFPRRFKSTISPPPSLTQT